MKEMTQIKYYLPFSFFKTCSIISVWNGLDRVTKKTTQGMVTKKQYLPYERTSSAPKLMKQAEDALITRP